jgi:hypothetical protein
VPSTEINTLEKPITIHQHLQPRMLGVAPTFTGSIPTNTITIKLGSTYSLTFPPISDETPTSVTVTVTYSSIPFIT